VLGKLTAGVLGKFFVPGRGLIRRRFPRHIAINIADYDHRKMKRARLSLPFPGLFCFPAKGRKRIPAGLTAPL
jgi:hypothetical protein